MEVILEVRRFEWSREFMNLIKAMVKIGDQNNQTLKARSVGKSEIKETVRLCNHTP